MKILVTGSAGFVAGYLIDELLNAGHTVIGIDNYSKYGAIEKSYDHHPRYSFVEGDCKDVSLMKEIIANCDQVIAIAAVVGGVGSFSSLAYDIFAENEKITLSTFDAAVWAFKNKNLKKINVISSSMVYEKSESFPYVEGQQRLSPPPTSSYAFQKLACEYLAQSAWEQHKLPYTIIRLFNVAGTGEHESVYSTSAMRHVIPDITKKILSGQNPVHILGNGNQIRNFIYGGDLAKGIRACVENPNAINQDFNLSTQESTSVLELTEMIWRKIYGDKVPFAYVSDEALKYDVQRSEASVEKAEKLLNFKAEKTLSDILDEVIPWVKDQLSKKS